MISLVKPSVSGKEAKAASHVILSGQLAQGEKVLMLEKDFAKYCGVKYAIAINNGTAAVHTALLAIGIAPGDEVITSPLTFVATANSIIMAGANPIFADIDSRTYNIDPKTVEKLITKKTKAILAVNLYGLPADYSKLKIIAKRHNLLLIEDAAQSVGATYKKKSSGNLADISCFSLYATKNLMTGEGGMITTNNSNYAGICRLIRNHGQSETKKYDYKLLGYNYRMSDVLAAIGIEQLKKIKTFNKKRQQNAAKYTNTFSKINGLITPFVPPGSTHVYHQYTILVTPSYHLTRNQLQQFLIKKGIQSTVYYPYPLYVSPHLKKGKRLANYPVTEQVTKSCLSIPIRPNLNNDELNYIINAIQST